MSDDDQNNDFADDLPTIETQLPPIADEDVFPGTAAAGEEPPTRALTGPPITWPAARRDSGRASTQPARSWRASCAGLGWRRRTSQRSRTRAPGGRGAGVGRHGRTVKSSLTVAAPSRSA
jgi:hypothetical protein